MEKNKRRSHPYTSFGVNKNLTWTGISVRAKGDAENAAHMDLDWSGLLCEDAVDPTSLDLPTMLRSNMSSVKQIETTLQRINKFQARLEEIEGGSNATEVIHLAMSMFAEDFEVSRDEMEDVDEILPRALTIYTLDHKYHTKIQVCVFN